VSGKSLTTVQTNRLKKLSTYRYSGFSVNRGQGGAIRAIPAKTDWAKTKNFGKNSWGGQHHFGRMGERLFHVERWSS